MARPKKAGLDYFSFDVDLTQNMKIRKIMYQYGHGSIAILIEILCRIYAEEGYFILCNDDAIEVIAIGISCTTETVVNVVNKAINVGFFDSEMFQEHGILTSKGIQKRYIRGGSRRSKVEIIEDYLLLSENDAEFSFINPVNVCKNPRSEGVNVYNNPVNVCKNPRSEGVNVCNNSVDVKKPVSVNVCKNPRSEGVNAYKNPVQRELMHTFIPKANNQITKANNQKEREREKESKSQKDFVAPLTQDDTHGDAEKKKIDCDFDRFSHENEPLTDLPLTDLTGSVGHTGSADKKARAAPQEQMTHIGKVINKFVKTLPEKAAQASNQSENATQATSLKVKPKFVIYDFKGEQKKAFDRFLNYGVAPVKAAEFTNDFTVEVIHEWLDKALKRHEAGKIKGSLAAYIVGMFHKLTQQAAEAEMKKI